MKIVLLWMLFGLSANLVYGQKILGRIIDSNNNPILGANIYIENSYDGTSSNENGFFEFETKSTGEAILVASCLGYKKHIQKITIEADKHLELNIKMVTVVNEMQSVTITAGGFDISDTKKASVLQPYDVATTPGALADITGALTYLPGNNSVGEDGRLFVRGGDGYETRSYIDGLLVYNFYGTTPKGMASRGRFSPFLFKGQYFSSGGYSAEYGDALSSILALKTVDNPIRTQTDVSLMSIGGSISHTQKWKNRSAFGELNYSTMEPYYNLVKQNIDWIKSPESITGSINYKEQLKNGSLKLYYQGSKESMSLKENGSNKLSLIQIKNQFNYLNANFKTALNNKWSTFLGVSFSDNHDKFSFESNENLSRTSKLVHTKAVLNGELNNSVQIKIGSETNFSNNHYTIIQDTVLSKNLSNSSLAFFGEPEITISPKIIVRTGLRYDYNKINHSTVISPRISMAYKTGNNSQFSLAYGKFSQIPLYEYLRVGSTLRNEKAFHYIANWHYSHNESVFRIEIFRKTYIDLIKYSAETLLSYQNLNNKGNGYAQGLDLFWKDRNLFRNLEYWITYSFIDTQRDYKDYPELAVPNFAAKHKLSFVSKYFVDPLRSQFGASYFFQTGRYYHDPNFEVYNAKKTADFHDLSLNWSLLIKQNFIVHCMVNNILGLDPIFTYKFENNPDENGVFQGTAIKRPAKRFYFVGIFFTISDDTNANQLNNL